jgi:serine/threonine protein kinase
MTGIAISLGDVIGGRYQLEAVLGHGGMAIVYKARNTGTGKACAVKIVHPHLVSRPEHVEMFIREARIAGRMGDHPNVVNVFDAAIDETRRVPFMVMELLQGQTLDEYLQTQAPMPWAVVRMLMEQLSDALEQAHRAGVIHRDLKPGNLFLARDRKGQPVLKIMDFGIAKVMEQAIDGTVTRVGSPLYAAPEQQAGDAFVQIAAKQGVTIAREVTPATDVWAIGLIAYELFTGLPKAQVWGNIGALNDLLVKVVLEPTPVPSARAAERASLLPRGFDGWFARCLMKNAAERWPSAKMAVEALLELLDKDEKKRTQRMEMAPGWAPPPVEGLNEPLSEQPRSSVTPRSTRPSFHDDPTGDGLTVRLDHSALLGSSQSLHATGATGSHSAAALSPSQPTIPQSPPSGATPIPSSSSSPAIEHQWPGMQPDAASLHMTAPQYRSSSVPEIQDPRQQASSTGTPLSQTLARPGQRRPLGLAIGAAVVGAVVVLLFIFIRGRETPEPALGSPQGGPESTAEVIAPPPGSEPPRVAAIPTGSPAVEGNTETAPDAPEAGASAEPAEPEGSPTAEHQPSWPTRERPAEKGSIYVASKGAGGECTVTVNGKEIGKTPLSKRVDAGKLIVRCFKAGGGVKAQMVNVQAGKHANVLFD